MGLNSVMQTAIWGLNAAQTSIQVAANNIANGQTPGFKASRVQLATLVVGGVHVAGIDPDFAPATIAATGELALWTLQGEGLFVLETERGERLYTPEGRLRFNADGELVTTDGLRVLGFNADAHGQIDKSRLVALRVRPGPHQQPGGAEPVTLRRFSISRDGQLLGHFSDGSRLVVGQLQLASFANPGGLAHRGGNTYSATLASGLPQIVTPGSAGAADVVDGALERSNTDLGRELIDLTLAGNLFRANLAVFYTADTLLDDLYRLTR